MISAGKDAWDYFTPWDLKNSFNPVLLDHWIILHAPFQGIPVEYIPTEKDTIKEFRRVWDTYFYFKNLMVHFGEPYFGGFWKCADVTITGCMKYREDFEDKCYRSQRWLDSVTTEGDDWI